MMLVLKERPLMALHGRRARDHRLSQLYDNVMPSVKGAGVIGVALNSTRAPLQASRGHTLRVQRRRGVCSPQQLSCTVFAHHLSWMPITCTFAPCRYLLRNSPEGASPTRGSRPLPT